MQALDWEPLIIPADFVGMRADMLTTATGIVSMLLIIVGIGLLVKMLR